MGVHARPQQSALARWWRRRILMAAPSPSRVLRLFALACCLCLLLLAGREYLDLGASPRSWALLVLALLFALPAALGGKMGPRATLACLATALALTLGFTSLSDKLLRLAPTDGVMEPAAPAAGPAGRSPGLQPEGFGDLKGIIQPHHRYVTSNIPGASVIHRKQEFRVRYTVDNLGHRVTPSPPGALRVTFYGCSFTFGDGVEDNETFTHLLGERHWKRFKVRNAGVRGWGAAQVYLALKDELEAAKPPRMVLYGVIMDHVSRSYIDAIHLVDVGRPFPHFEVEGDRLIFKGYITEEKGLSPDDELVKKSQAVWFGLVREMHRLCQARGIPFHVILIHKRDQPPGAMDFMARGLDDQGIPYMDLGGMTVDAFYPIDQHPTRVWHDALARKLAGDPRIKGELAATVGP